MVTPSVLGSEQAPPIAPPANWPVTIPSPRDPALQLVETLTKREARVLARFARRLTNQEIAAELSFSPPRRASPHRPPW